MENKLHKKLAVISVIHENYGLLDDFLGSFANQTNNDFHLFILDQSSVKKPIADHGLKLTVLESENLGYAHGVNIGLKEAKRRGYGLFCVINNDVIFNEKFIESALARLNKTPHSVIGGKIYYAPGYEYHRQRYKRQERGKILWYAGGEIDWDHMEILHRGVDKVDNHQYDKFEETEFITGCLILFDKNVLDRVGFWNEKYFLYYEDADFCIRAERRQVGLYYDPSLVIWHKVSQSTGGSGSSIHQKYQAQNKVRLGLKYAPLRTKIHLVKNFFLASLKSRKK